MGFQASSEVQPGLILKSLVLWLVQESGELPTQATKNIKGSHHEMQQQ